MAWDEKDIPSQTGRVAIVTGANSGLGLETARALYTKGAHVVMACRSLDKGHQAAKEVEAAGRKQGGEAVGTVEVLPLDLSEPSSIKDFTRQLKGKYDKVDLLINNGGIMAPPQRKENSQGWEMQLATNHIGHFLLTQQVLPLLEKAGKGARVVNHSSMAHSMLHKDAQEQGLRYGDGCAPCYNREGVYVPYNVYGESKMANMLFTQELQRRLERRGSSVITTCAHPGWSNTGLQAGVVKFLSFLVGQHARTGALPQLRAAVDPGVRPGDYYGPQWLMRGAPVVAKTHPTVAKEEAGRLLWEQTEQWAGTRFL